MEPESSTSSDGQTKNSSQEKENDVGKEKEDDVSGEKEDDVSEEKDDAVTEENDDVAEENDAVAEDKEDVAEEKEEEVRPATKKNPGGRPRSYIWDHYTDAISSEDGKPNAQCNYCHEKFLTGNIKVMRRHLEFNCEKIPSENRKAVIKLIKLHQAQLRAKPEPIKQSNKEDGTSSARGFVWDHFVDVKNKQNKRIAKCIYCDRTQSAYPIRMRNHLERHCAEIPDATRRKVAELNRIHNRALEASRMDAEELIDQQLQGSVEEQQPRPNRDRKQRAKKESRRREKSTAVFPPSAASSLYQQPQQPPLTSSRVQQMQPAIKFVQVDDDAPSWAVSMAASINSNLNTQFATLSSQLSSLSSQLASQTANVEAQLMNANARLSNIELQLQLKHQSSSKKRKRGHDSSRQAWDSENEETEEENYYGNEYSEEDDYEDAEEYV